MPGEKAKKRLRSRRGFGIIKSERVIVFVSRMLYIVVTPIGNLSDMTYRAVEVLGSVDLVLCEDTRHSAVLLSHYGITTPTRSYEKFSESRNADEIADMLAAGKNIALVSDAGTPVISDPGNVLVRKLKERGLPYTVVGSGCAAVSALVLSGMDASDFCFAGFLPEKEIDRKRKAEKYRKLPSTLIFYVAPHDARRDVEFLGGIYGARRACLVREISKLHEEVIDFVLPDLPEDATLRGEMVLVVEGAGDEAEELNALSIEDHMAHYTAGGMSEKDAMKAVARDRGVSKSEIYAHLKRG